MAKFLSGSHTVAECDSMPGYYIWRIKSSFGHVRTRRPAIDPLFADHDFIDWSARNAEYLVEIGCYDLAEVTSRV